MILPLVERNGVKKLSNCHYFDGPAKLRAWQDKYALAMIEKFPTIKRGLRYSKQVHITKKRYYAMQQENDKILNSNQNRMEKLNAAMTEKDLLEIKTNSQEKTLVMYQKQNLKYKKQIEKLEEELKENKLYADRYKLLQQQQEKEKSR